jgi:S1-C subfamily serine protease
MRICEPEFALENVWHVMDVLEGSPAESAGLVPYGDWIIGWSGGVLGAEGDFYDVVEAVRVLLFDVRRLVDGSWKAC